MLLKLRWYRYYIPLFVLVWGAVMQLGCLGKVDRACETDSDCVTLYPKIFCLAGVCRDRACSPGASQSCYSGPTGTAGVGICRPGTQTCDEKGLWSACAGEVLPGADICDQLDNNCDGNVDEPPPGQTKDWCKCNRLADERICYSGPDKTANLGECTTGIQICRKNYLWGPCLNEVRPAREICDQRDNDCNGKIDDSPLCVCEPGRKQLCYSGSSKQVGVGICQPGQQTCSAERTWGPCEGEMAPQETDICDNDKDDNCDGRIDEGCAKSCVGETPDLCGRLCVNLQSDPSHCGTCGNAIPDDRRCCAGKATQIKGDASHCGACGNACPGTQACVEGLCQDRCGGLLPDLCSDQCVNLKQDPRHCGACGTSCKDQEQCINGACLPRCSSEYPTLCGEQCVDEKRDPRHCGACGKSCQDTEYCKAGTCQPFCPPPYTENCNGKCVDPQTDNDHCGGCDNSCTTNGDFCEQGKCTRCQNNQSACGNSCCAPGLTCCQGNCVDLTNHPQHCGVCGQSCGNKESCSNKQCTCKDGDSRFCFTGTSAEQNTGRCKSGLELCLNGQWGPCKGEITATQELCNGLDDDCNGQIDDNPTLTQKCPQQGICNNSLPKCENGKEICDVPGFETEETLCDGLDNDCDGQIDEGLAPYAPPCANQMGICKGAKQRCVLGSWRDCDVLGYEPVETSCDGKDNDCDGQTDPGCRACIATSQVSPNSLINGGGVNGIQSIAIHPNGKWLAFGQGNSEARIWVEGTILHTFRHGSPVLGIAFSNDGKYLFTVSTTSIKIWDVLTGFAVSTLSPSPGERLGTEIDVSPNNLHVAISQSSSGSAINTIGIWDLQQNKRIATMIGHTGQINDLHFRADGMLLASASQDKTVRVWDTSTYKQIKVLTAHTDEVRSVHFVAGRSLLASGSGSNFQPGTLHLWDTTTWTVAATLPDAQGPSRGLGNIAPIEGLRSSFDGTLLYAAGGQPDYSIRVWDISNPQQIRLRHILHGMQYSLLHLRVSADSQTLIAASTLEVRRWHCPQTCTFSTTYSNTHPKEINAHPNQAITDLSFFGNDSHIMTSGADKKTNVWTDTRYETLAGSITTSDVLTQSRLRPYPFPPGPYATAFDKTIAIYARLFPNPAPLTNAGVPITLTTNATITKLFFNPNDVGLVIGTTGNAIERYNGSLSAKPTLKTSAQVDALAISNNGHYLASGGADGAVEIWDDPADTRRTTVGPFLTGAVIAPIKALVFHPSDDHKIAIAFAQRFEVWDISGAPAKLFASAGTNGHTADITALVWSPDGTTIASSGLDGTARLWDASTGAYIQTMTDKVSPPPSPITHLGWSSDGQTIAAGTSTGQLKVWSGSSCNIQ